MYRFLLRPKWIAFHLLVLAGVIVMVNLAFWQLRRLDERQDFNAEVSARIDLPAVPVDEALRGDDQAAIDAARWRTVTATGTYDDDQIVVVNRSQGGRAGSMVVTPLHLEDGRVLLVERGFVPLADDPDAPPPPPPDGEVTVTGRLRESQVRRRGGLSDTAEGVLTEAQRIDIDRLAPQLDGPVVPMYVELVAADPPIDPATDPAPVARPTLDEGSHLSYTVQWFIFAACAGAGWVFAVRRSAASREHDRRRAGLGTGASATPAPVDATTS